MFVCAYAHTPYAHMHVHYFLYFKIFLMSVCVFMCFIRVHACYLYAYMNIIIIIVRTIMRNLMSSFNILVEYFK